MVADEEERQAHNTHSQAPLTEAAQCLWQPLELLEQIVTCPTAGSKSDPSAGRLHLMILKVPDMPSLKESKVT